jgi:hypothetical protein
MVLATRIDALEVVTSPGVARMDHLLATGALKGTFTVAEVITVHNAKTILRANLARRRRVIVRHAQEPHQNSQGAMHRERPAVGPGPLDLVMRPSGMAHRMNPLVFPIGKGKNNTRVTWPFPIPSEPDIVKR